MDGITAAGTTWTMENTVIVLAASQAAAGAISTADLFAAAITVFVFIIIPLIIWTVRFFVNEGKRRAVDSLNMAATRKSNDDIRVLLEKHIEKEEKDMGEVKEDVAGLKAIIRMGGSNGRH